jgi:hypothetical protein
MDRLEQLDLIDPASTKRDRPKKAKPWIDFIPPSADKIIQMQSYGGGQQSFAGLILVGQGRLPHPDLIVFADPGQEDPDTYQHMTDHAIPLMERLGIPQYTVRREIGGDTRDIYQYHWDHQITPIWPTCTSEFKLRPISRLLNELYDIKPGLHQIDSWIGITTDEDHRATPSGVAYIRKTFPLLDLGLSRQDCINLTLQAGYPVPPESGCIICCHKDWRYNYTARPAWFKAALALDSNASAARPRTALPEHGPSLRQIVLQPQFDLPEFKESCGTGYCHT